MDFNAPSCWHRNVAETRLLGGLPEIIACLYSERRVLGVSQVAPQTETFGRRAFSACEKTGELKSVMNGDAACERQLLVSMGALP
jgi:hypothetical protein